MNLASLLARCIPSDVRKRGLDYLRKRRVHLLSCDAQEAAAEVFGSHRYDVLLTRVAKDLFATCTCAFFEGGHLCKHIWATVLAVDTWQGLRGPGGTLPVRLVPCQDGERGRTPSPSPARERPVPRGPGWRQLLDEIPGAGRAPALRADPVYVLDAPATRSSRQLTLDLMSVSRTSTGPDRASDRDGELLPLRISRSEIPRLSNPADRQILSLLAGRGPGAPRPADSVQELVFQTTPIPTRYEIPLGASGLLVPLLCATGRCRLRSGPDPEPGPPLAWDGGEPWQLCLEVEEDAQGSCALAVSLRRGEERLAFDEAVLLLEPGVVFTATRAARFDAGGAFGSLAALRRLKDVPVPAAERDELLARLLEAPALPRLALPASLRVEEAQPVPQARLRLQARSEPPRGPLLGELSFVYEERHDVPARDPRRGVYARQERRFLRRHLEAERQAFRRLEDLGFRQAREGPQGFPLELAPGRAPAVLLTLLGEGWSVEAQGVRYRSPGSFRLGIASGVDWFELHGEAEFEGAAVRLPELLAALRRGDGFVPLGDGSVGLLPQDWIDRVSRVAEFAEPAGDHLKFRPVHAALLDAWLAEQPEASCDEAFERARQRLQGFEGVAPAEAPPGFLGELRGYQREGLGWLHFLRDFGFGGCLADDMGLGKTVQVLALLESRRQSREREGRPSLAVVPRSLIFNWLSEAARFTPELRVLDHTGAGRSRSGAGAADLFAGCDLVLTTYGTLRRDIETLRQVEFDYAILDEAQAIKNAGSQTARTVRLLRARHRLALTGTPLENHLGELWSLLEFLNPGLLGSGAFRRLPPPQTADLDPEPEARALVGRAVRPFLLRRTKEQVAAELPAKLEQTLVCELPPKQRRLYDELRDHYRAALGERIGRQGLGSSKILVLEALLRLRQAACHPGLLDPRRAGEPSAKLDLLLPLLRQVAAEGHKALVFSQFTTFLGLLRKQLDAEGLAHVYLDGRARDRQERVERFQSSPGIPLFLISLKAGGVGLNLTAADYVYLLDPWWNPAVEAQAIDRAHRIGQTRPVFANRIIARNTVEEKILELQKSKRDLADAILQADRGLLAGLSRDDLDLLLA